MPKNLKEKMDIMRKHGNNKNKPNGNFKLRSTISKVKFFLKTIALTRQTFVGKVMSLLFNMLSWLVITFLPVSVF